MSRKTVIIYKTEVPECFGNFKLFCQAKGVKHNTFARKKLPFMFEGFEVHRVEFKGGNTTIL